MFPYKTNSEDRPWFAAFAAIVLTQTFVILFSLKNQGADAFTPQSGFLDEGLFPTSVPSISPFLAAIKALLLGLDASPTVSVQILFSLGVLLLIVSAIWVYQLTARLTNCLGGAVAGLLFLANGEIISAYLTPSPDGWLCTLVLGTALGLAAWQQEESVVGQHLGLLSAALAPITHPIGMILPVLVIALALLRRERQTQLPIVGLMLMVFPLISMELATLKASGSAWPSGSTPMLSIHAMAEALDKFVSNDLPSLFVPGMLALVLFGGALSAVQDGRARRPGIASLLFALWLLCPVVLLTLRLESHLLIVVGIPLAIVGAHRVASVFHQHEESVLKAIGLALGLLSLPGLAWALLTFSL